MPEPDNLIAGPFATMRIHPCSLWWLSLLYLCRRRSVSAISEASCPSVHHDVHALIVDLITANVLR